MTDPLMLYRTEPPMEREGEAERPASCGRCRHRWRCDGWVEDEVCEDGEVES